MDFIDYQATEGYFPFTHLVQSLEFTFFAGILTYCFLALAEEMVYRGLVFRYLFKNTSHLQFALIISSIIFSLLHFNKSPLFYITAFLIGYLLALIYYHSGSLLYSISIHWSYDLFMFIGKNFLDDHLNMQSQIISGWGDYSNLIKIPFLILIILAIHMFMKRNKSIEK
ncbi:CPBP family intramembrane metalloprotease [Aliifodinibius halophilus]|uniref:CPBP family intramembrane metalloprotease n=1 Tax=Fodinibius halophilus TaxID=1736908 RepID=A0A6M1TBN5_9BACT|nr:CPBP family intramembrane metalloprotease [Fodinibius halophilus]